MVSMTDLLYDPTKDEEEEVAEDKCDMPLREYRCGQCFNVLGMMPEKQIWQPCHYVCIRWTDYIEARDGV